MRYFVTGASGWVGSAVVPELVAAGHEVVGLVRSSEGADRVATAGGTPHQGDLSDTADLAARAAESDGVVHLGFVHDFSRFLESVAIDRAAIEAMGAALAGSDRPLVAASGIAGIAVGRVATEQDQASEFARGENERIVLGLAADGVRSVSLRLAPSVHGEGDFGFVPTAISVARERGVSAYVGDGSNRWAGVHRSDAAVLARLALESAPAGTVVHAVQDEGVPWTTIAAIIGRHLDLPVVSIAAEEADAHFGFLGRFVSEDLAASSALTRELLGWSPGGPDLVADLEAGHYFTGSGARMG